MRNGSKNAGSIGTTPFVSGALNGRIPETTEVRTGIAVFPTKKFMAAFDTIYTSGFSRNSNQNDIFYSVDLKPIYNKRF
ncbi:MAG: hypothetical protein IPO06_07505 [Leptospiraceae bacterium]|nr:hypothetical protein [Leptospiraceae bacterium]